jgi:hypothetical protein
MTASAMATSNYVDEIDERLHMCEGKMMREEEKVRDLGLVAEIAVDALDDVPEAGSRNPLFGNVEERERNIDNDNLLEVLADRLDREKLKVARCPPPNVEPYHLASAHGPPDRDALCAQNNESKHATQQESPLGCCSVRTTSRNRQAWGLPWRVKKCSPARTGRAKSICSRNESYWSFCDS